MKPTFEESYTSVTRGNLHRCPLCVRALWEAKKEYTVDNGWIPLHIPITHNEFCPAK